jgi:solute carrier family 25 aspartate/glutamate transporter 12/13
MFPLHDEATAEKELGPRGTVEPITGLQEATAPLPYLRSRNALKIILDLDLGFGKAKVPKEGLKSWVPGLKPSSAEPKE